MKKKLSAMMLASVLAAFTFLGGAAAQREPEEEPTAILNFLILKEDNGKPVRTFTNGAMKLLVDYDFPGNVRELENAVERAVVLSTQEHMDADLLPEAIRTREIVRGVRLQLNEFLPSLPGEAGGRETSPSLFAILEEVERRIIVDMLERTNWNQTEASDRFQVPLSTLNQKIKRLGIETRRRNPSARPFDDDPPTTSFAANC